MDVQSQVHNSISITGPLIPFGSPVVLSVGSGQKFNELSDLSSGTLKLKTVISGTNGQPYTICKPYISWITSYTITITFKGGKGEQRTVLYTGNNGRGDAGFIYTLIDQSSGRTEDVTMIQNLNPPMTTSKLSLDATIPLRYLIDPLCTKRYLPISYFTIVPVFDTILNIFSPGANMPNFAATVVRYALEYPSYRVKSMPGALMYPDPRLTFVNRKTYPINTSTILETLNVPGKLLRVFYFMVEQKTSLAAGGSPNPYNFNPNPSSVTTYHQINGAGCSFPLNPEYNAVFDLTAEVGIARHYEEFIQIINKNNPPSNTVISYTTWRDNYRIYAIEVNNSDFFNQTILSLTINLGVATTKPFDLYIVNQYLPSIANLSKDDHT